MKVMLSQEPSRWLAKVCRVLIFTMLCSTFLYQGWYKPQSAEAAITYQTPGAISYSAAAGATVAPAYPAGIAANDLLVMIVGMKPSAANSGSVTTPAGWTPIVSLIGAGGYGATLAADTGNTNLFAYYKVAAGTETGSLTVTIATSNISWAQIYRLSKTLAVWKVAGTTLSDITGVATVSIAFGTDPGFTPNDFILGAMCIPTDVTTPAQFTVEAFTQTGATFGTVTEISEPDSATGNQIGGFVISAAVSAGAGSAAPTMTATAGGTLTNVRGPGVFIRIREAKLPSTITSCSDCHGYTSAFTDGTARNTPAGAFVGTHSEHVEKVQYDCSICHVTPPAGDFGHRTGNIQMNAGATAIQGGYYDKNNNFAYNVGTDDTWAQTNTVTPQSCRTVACHGGNDPTPQWGAASPWGAATAGCINCHNGVVSALKASALTGGAVTQRDNAVAEFGLAYGHKPSGKTPARGAVTNADCIVCHLEGDFTTQKTSAKHADGYIDLRDPDDTANGENPIKDMSGVAFRFVQFSTSYAAGSRTSTGHTSNNVDNVLTQKFCLACHDSNGATNTTARTAGGTATMPWGGINLGANYTIVNGAAIAGGLVDVKTQFTTTNSSAHPVLGPRSKDFPTAARMNDPYKPAGTRGTSGTLSQGVVLNCFDCHNTPTQLTNRTIVAHGNAVTIPGVLTITGNAPAAGTNQVTFCIVCHIGYDSSTATHHNTGSALNGSTNNGMLNYLRYACNVCHSSGYNTAVVRPIRGQDVHGSNVLPTGGLAKVLRWSGASTGTPAQVNAKPYAFIRNTEILTTHNPLSIGGSTYSPGCTMGNGTPNCSRAFQAYTVGGTY